MRPMKYRRPLGSAVQAALRIKRTIIALLIKNPARAWWYRADGSRLRVEDMSDGHVLNSLRLFQARRPILWRRVLMQREATRRGLQIRLSPDRA